MTRSRPLGVSLIALLFLFEAILALGMAALLLLKPASSSGFSSLLEGIALPVAMSSLLAVPPLLAAALAGLIFRGLWEQREWARVATIVLAFLLALAAVVAIAFQFAFGLQSTSSLTVSIISLLLAGGILVYLLSVRFADSSPPESRSEEAPAATPAALPPSPLPQQTTSPQYSTDFVPPPPKVSTAPRPLGQDATLASQTHDPTQKLSAQAAAKADATPVAWLNMENGAQPDLQIALYAHQNLTLGRDASRVDAVISDPTVSGRHAEIRYEQGRFVIYDLNSTNGTYRGAYRIQRYPLLDGDVIQLGNVVLRFMTAQPTISNPTQPPAPPSPA